MIPSSRHIVYSTLAILIFGKILFKFDINFIYLIVVVFASMGFFHFISHSVLVKKLSFQNTLICASILTLLLSPPQTILDWFILFFIAGILMSIRSFIRYNHTPIFNPVVLSLLGLTWTSYFIENNIYVWWQWVNYAFTLAWYSIPFATLISLIASILLVISMKKTLYFLWFFITFALLWSYLLSVDTMKYILFDGTIYFFFGIMVCEPKTSVNGKWQVVFGCLLGLILTALLYYKVSFAYILVIAIINIIFFSYKFLKNQSKNLDQEKVYQKWKKWLCVPCGYIYDPIIWDEDSGILPGTEFTDIPENWRCPVCGVTKADFIPYDEWAKKEEMEYLATIVEKTFLNPTTIELVIETQEFHKSKVGQFASFIWKDEKWTFIRSYSIVEHHGNKLSFTIKLWELGRGAHLLREISVGANIRIKWVFGNFLLKDTTDPKIFIATGTGLAPIYNMILSLPLEVEKSLYFSVATQKELFYVDKLRAIKNLNLHIHVTREEWDWYKKWRVDVDTIETSPESEWYLCGSPKMVTEAVEKLRAKWFEKVYSEEFN